MNKETILKEIQRLAAANNGIPPGRLALESETGIRMSAWCGVYWARWSDAVKEAGFEPNKIVTAYPKERLLDALAHLTMEIGRFPTNADLRLKARPGQGFPAEKTFSKLGSRVERITLLLSHCRNRQGLEKAIAICESTLAGLPMEPEADAPSLEIDGYVYLLKSGRHYKIGRSNNPDRRERELAYQTVEKNVRVHMIQTDDPSGIETYWHHRFADKRVRPDGEWFALNAKDITAFRRRKKFM